MKVYCKDCKHAKKDPSGSYWWKCKLTKEVINRPTYPITSYKDCNRVNHSNTCKNFEPNIWNVIKDYFKKVETKYD